MFPLPIPNTGPVSSGGGFGFSGGDAESSLSGSISAGANHFGASDSNWVTVAAIGGVALVLAAALIGGRK